VALSGSRRRDVGRERDKAGNRQLHFDPYCMLMICCYFTGLASAVAVLPIAVDSDPFAVAESAQV
jgi:hypothetical protein